jgi:lipopolysaccharide export LptBFGC system permease protein LptF
MVVFNTIFLVFDLFDHVSRFLEANLPWFQILRYYGGLISSYSHWFAPASLMLATLYTMWHLSRNSEITAMRASGISFASLATPFVATSVLVAVLIATTAEYISPDASAWSSRLKEKDFNPAAADVDMRLRHPYYNTVGRRMWVFDSVDVASERSLSCVTNRLTVTQERPDGISDWAFSAERADYLDGAWWFTHPSYTRYDIDGGELPSVEAPLGAPTLVRMPDFDETPRDILMEVRDWDTYSVRDMLRALSRRPVHDPGTRFDIHYRFASPWACVVITLFAVPAGLTTARQSVLRGVFTALGAFFGFYALTHFGMFLGTQGMAAPWLVAWAPIAACFVASCIMYRRLT